MKPIKFRVWDKSLCIMYNDICDIHFDQLGVYSIEHTNNWDDKKGVMGKYIELMQFTGLKDRNGKEIYENDIVTHPTFTDGTPGTVMMHEGQWVFHWTRDECVHQVNQEYRDIEYYTPLYQWRDEVEIIGNKYVYNKPIQVGKAL